MRALRSAVLTVVVMTVSLGGCGSATSGESHGTTLTVSAASSLTEAFTEVATSFEAANPGVTVRLNFAGSGSLAEQVIAGAPVDVLATASRATMDPVTAAGLVGEAPTFATNTLTIAVPRGNPAGITAVEDLAAEGVRVAQCDAAVPCGAAARTTLAQAGVALTPVTLDPDVKTVLGRVASGEVDAGLVYATDITSADVDAIALPESIAGSTDYAIGVVRSTAHPDLAQAFVDYVQGPVGSDVLTAQGFGTP